MPRSPRQLVGSFADLMRYGHELTVNCEGCQHRAPVSVPALAKRLGARYGVQAFIERSVCSQCGARSPKIGVTVTPAASVGYRKD
jgi:hypothetical protein